MTNRELLPEYSSPPSSLFSLGLPSSRVRREKRENPLSVKISYTLRCKKTFQLIFFPDPFLLSPLLVQWKEKKRDGWRKRSEI